MTPFTLLPVQLPGAPLTAGSLPRAPAGATFALPEGLLQLTGTDELSLLAASGAWSPEFLAMLQQLLPHGMSLPAAGMKLPESAAGLAAPAAGANGPPAGTEQVLLARLQAGASPPELPAPLPVSGSDEPLVPVKLPVGGLPLQGLAPVLAATGDTDLDSALTAVLPGAAPSAAGLVPAGTSATPAAAPSAMLMLPQRLGEPGWQQALGERVLWLAGREQQVAELRLNPPHLGPLEVRVTVQHDQASVAFVSHHAAVREVLEQAVPRLREMLGQHDLQLVQVDVGERRAPQQQADGGGGGQRGHGPAAGPAEAVAGTPTAGEAGVRAGLGLVDLFA